MPRALKDPSQNPHWEENSLDEYALRAIDERLRGEAQATSVPQKKTAETHEQLAVSLNTGR